MKHLIIISMFISLGMSCFAAESGEIINTEKVNQLLEVENFKKSDKDQETLNLYKERLDLLSYKERQLNMYENSLKSLKSEMDVMQANLDKKQTELNDKEISLFKKELELKEKERDLNQLEEKLAQIDNIQLMRESQKLSSPSVELNVSSLQLKEDLDLEKTDNKPIQKEMTNTEVKNGSEDNHKVKNEKSIKKEKVKSNRKRVFRRHWKTKKPIGVLNIESGLGQMKKDILTNNTFKEK